MKILYSGIGIVDGSGKLNGSVMSKNRGGNYVRVKVTPINPQSVNQANARNIIATHAQAWRGLTQVQRDGWNSSVTSFPYTDRFGNVRYLSGFNLFVKFNANLNYADASGIDAAPAPVDIPAITALSITSTAGTPTVSVVFGPSPVPAGYALILRLTPNVAPGKSFVKNLYRNVAVVAAAGTTPHNTLTAFEAQFGVPVVGQQIFVQAFIISTDTGQAGIPLTAGCIVGA